MCSAWRRQEGREGYRTASKERFMLILSWSRVLNEALLGVFGIRDIYANNYRDTGYLWKKLLGYRILRSSFRDTGYSQKYCNISPWTRLARGKFELTNQVSAGGENSSVLMSSWNQATFVTGDGIKYPRKGIYNFKNQTSCQKVKNMNHSVFLNFYFGAKNGSQALCMETRS